jgi:hypothetical protein
MINGPTVRELIDEGSLCEYRLFAPYAPDLSGAPTRNNWWMARGTGVGTTFTGTLPPTMRTGSGNLLSAPVPALVSINGVVIGAVHPGSGNISGPNIVSGSRNYATGAVTITLNAASLMPANAQMWIEDDIGNGTLVFDGTTFVSWTEGTIGRNPTMNALLDPTAASGSGLLTTAGLSTVAGIPASSVPYGFTFSDSPLQTALGNGSVAAALSSITDADGFPMLRLDIEGMHTATITPTLTTGNMNNYLQRVTAGDWVMSGAKTRFARHATINRHYGNNGYTGQVSLFLTGSAARTHRGVTKNVTGLTSRVHDQGTGIYAVDDLILNDEGGAFEVYRCSPLLNTTGAVIATPQANFVMGRMAANMPAAYALCIGRLQGGRRRNDVI